MSYTITRAAGAIGKELTVAVRTREVGRASATVADHNVTFPPWVDKAELTVVAPVDDLAETGANTFRANVRCNSQPYDCGDSIQRRR